MEKEYLFNLLSKYKKKNCSAEELEMIEDWYQNLDTGNHEIDDFSKDQFSNDMLVDFNVKLHQDAIVIPFYRKPFFRYIAAASVLVCICFATLFINKSVNKPALVHITNKIIKDIPAPIGSMARITLSNGKTIALDSINSGTLFTQNGVEVKKAVDGSLIYVGNSNEVIFNTLFNPRGSKAVSLTLIDGSKVWLNSESSLHYPITFIGNERVVEITGEAYFEVAKDPNRKFIVKSNGVNTEVLGTHFNVNTYADQSSINITLLEGSVKVVKGNNVGYLMPGQQAQINTEIKVIHDIDVEAIMSWKNGFFHFEHTDMIELMNQLSRWYDVEVVFKSSVPKRAFGGEISREANLSQIVSILNEAKVKCNIEGKQLIIE